MLPQGLIQGQSLTEMLRRLTLPVARITSFDDLPTPFRAVATDLETGQEVVMGSGDLTSAMRASLSAPGVFAPVERGGRLLVDGGISDNVPVDVARAMGVDVVIVVDVGFPLLPRSKLTSVTAISNQMLAILMRRKSQQELAQLGAARHPDPSAARRHLVVRLRRRRIGCWESAPTRPGRCAAAWPRSR